MLYITCVHAVQTKKAMLPRPRSVFEDVADDARAPVPTGMERSDTVFIGRYAAPSTKEETIVRFMEVVIEAQKHRQWATFRVAKAVSQMDKSNELFPFSMAKQDLDLAEEDIEQLQKLMLLYTRLRD